MKTYFIPIKSYNLVHYLSRALICPVRYLEERNSDIQDVNPDQILISKRKLINDNNCSIEVLITPEEEEKSFKKLTDFLILDRPLPISRIRHIWFTDEEQKVNTMWNIRQGSAFLPEHLVSCTDEKPIEFEVPKYSSENKVDHSQDIKRFDQMLGGFALMRLGGESFMNYSPDYFQTLSIINGHIKRELEKVIAINSKKKYINKIPMNDTSSKYEKLIDFMKELNENNIRDSFYNPVDIKKVEESAKKEKIELQKKLGKLVLENIDKKTKTYLYAILASYGERQTRLTLDNFISDFILDEKFPKERKEGISLIFGLNKGYKVFRSYYETQNFKAIVKFELDSLIDYHTIESVYQYVFMKTIVDNFSRFEFESLIEQNKATSIDSQYLTYRLLDKDVIYAKKPTIMKELLKLIKSKIFFSEISKPLVDYFSKTNNIKLTPDQKRLKSKEYEELLDNPIKEMIDELEPEISEFFKESMKEKDEKLQMLIQQKNEFFKILKKANKDLFEKYSKKVKEELSNEELELFLTELSENNGGRNKSTDNKTS